MSARRVMPGGGGPTLRPWVPKLARLMDSAFRVPGTNWRFGLDPIVGLIPGAGDVLTALVSCALIAEAFRLGLARREIGRMLLNIAIDLLAGLVPGVDIVLDAAFKANVRNAEILERAMRGEADAE